MLPLTARERVKLWCLTSGMTQVKIAEKIGVNKQDVAHVCAGSYRNGRVVDEMAGLMGTTKEWLVDGKGKPPEWANKEQIPTIEIKSPNQYPILGHAGASDSGQRGLMSEHPEMKHLPKNLALIAVRGSSASPVIYDNQYALINLTRKVNPNNVVVVVLMDSDAVIVKRWCPQSDGEHVVLASLDGGRDSIAVHTHEVRHVWPVVGVLYE